MKLEVYVIRNKKLKCSGQPIFDDHNVENFAIGFERMLRTAPAEKVFQYTNTELYHIASYDDESMILVPCEREMLVDCNFVLEDRDLKKEVFDQVEAIKKAEVLDKAEEVKEDGSDD